MKEAAGNSLEIKGPQCTVKGTDGGNGGNGGNSGKPGDTGAVTFKISKGHKQEFKHRVGYHGTPGNYGKGKAGGKQGLGGCGEKAECSKVGDGHFLYTSCKSTVRCDGWYKGAPCQPNSNGNDGVSGINPSFSANFDKTRITIESGHRVDAAPVFLDYLLKYAIILANEETINESQEILVFLTKYQGGIGQSASQLLDRMGKNGDFDSYTKPIPTQPYRELTKNTERLIRRGQRIETTLNKFGELFEFKAFVYEVLDLMLEESDAYMKDLRLVSNSFFGYGGADLS